MEKRIILIVLLFIKFTILCFKYLDYREENDISIITINNLKPLNSIKKEILLELNKTLDIIDINRIHSLIIIGRDINSFSILIDEEICQLTKKESEEFSKMGNNILRRIEQFPIISIAALNGLTLGIGLEIALSCDIRICSENAVFGLPQVGIGIIPGLGGMQRLTRLIGLGMSKQIIYTAQNINSYEALRIGLVNKIFYQNDLLIETKKYALNLGKKQNYKNYIQNDNKLLDYVIFQIQIKYETKINENIYMYGNNSDFGFWKPKFKLHWNQGHIWKTEYKMSKSSNCIKFKFVCHSDSMDIWEKGENRLLCPYNLKGLTKTKEGKIILDFVWNHFKINFNIHYTPPNEYTYMQICGSPKVLSNWQANHQKPIKMELKNNKEIIAKDGNKIKGFWTLTVLMRIYDKNNLDFEYKYSLIDQKNGTAIWEREPNRHIHIYTNEEEMSSISPFNDNKILTEHNYLLTNSFLEILDVNFVANLNFNKMGDKDIYIGPYPQSENDFIILSNIGIDIILNVQSDKDFEDRQINHELQINQAKKYNINIIRYPIEDFNQEDLFKKLKGAGDLLNKLVKERKKIYVHCTAGMSRAAATVIIYLVLYENYTVQEADNFCKKYRPVICPNYGVINKIANIYRPGTEIKGANMYEP